MDAPSRARPRRISRTSSSSRCCAPAAAPRLLLKAKIALYLKDSLRTSTDVLTLFARALSGLSDERVAKARYLSLRSRPAKGRIPVRDLANELKEQLPTAAVYQDLPRGRKRSGWKREFTRALETAVKVCPV